MEAKDPKEFKADSQQQQVIDFLHGEALVLAPPGCGKTDVLAYRIIKAHRDYGVPYSSMLCLTFTNRASREMQQRVRAYIPGPTHGLFIGNLHRFALQFLYENSLISLNTSLIDEDDQLNIINELSDLPYMYSASSVSPVLLFATRINQERAGIPEPLRSLSRGKKAKLKHGEEALAKKYVIYKDQYNLIDYDDLLTLTYNALATRDHRTLKMTNYSWIQVDEIQDMNPLQLAIVDMLKSEESPTVVFLGDEQQAIFSFIGADISRIASMKRRMKIFNFHTNYRSPKYLVDFINLYARSNLNLHPEDLPASCDSAKCDDGLTLMGVNDSSDLGAIVAAQARQLYNMAPKESIGILTRTNANIDSLAELLDRHHLQYLKLSRKDEFKMVSYKTLYSHMAVVANEYRWAEWARLLFQTKIFKTLADAQKAASDFREMGLSFTDLLRDDKSSYLVEWAKAYDLGEMVVVDVESTGLNIFEDEVIQIAAVRINSEGVIPNSEFMAVIDTDLEIPQYLADGIKNPMIEIYESAERMDFESAIKAFIDYAGESPVIGHNVTFDKNILLSNIERRTDIDPSQAKCLANVWDSLKLARMIDPRLRSHRLGDLIKYYHLEGENSHNAIDDVKATANLIKHLRGMAEPKLEAQLQALASSSLQKLRTRFKNRYGSYYRHTANKLYSDVISEKNSLITELKWLYDNLLKDKYIEPIRRFDYMLELFKKVLFDDEREPYFYQQLLNHVYEMRTFTESDLYNNGVIKENMHIMTIHKAKGLQFDNVIVYGANEFPNWMDNNEDGSMEECKRLLYVAISRARKRLYFAYYRYCTKLITPEMRAMCQILSPEQVDLLLKIEDVYKI